MRALIAVVAAVVWTATTGAVPSVAAVDRTAEPSGAAPPSVRRLDPMSLPRGPNAAVDYLAGTVLHTATGKRIRLRLGAESDRLALLGRSGRGWLVAGRTRIGNQVWKVRPCRRAKRMFAFRVPGAASKGYRLSREGGMLAVTRFDRIGSQTRAFDVRSRTGLGRWFDGSYTRPLDVVDGHVLMPRETGEHEGLVDWQPGTGPTGITVLAPDAVAGFWLRDLMFVATGEDRYGPTSISAPGTPSWGASFAPFDVSPDGAHVLGWRFATRPWHDVPILEVRSMTDGTLVDAIRNGPAIGAKNWYLGREHQQTIRWESATTFVQQMPVGPGRAVLVRCDLAATCERASGVAEDFTMAYEWFIWW